jgi:hypothetical protein
MKKRMAMKVVDLLLPLSAVVTLSLASSFGLLYILSSKSVLNLGNGQQINLSSSLAMRLWGTLLGLSAGGFSLGTLLAPDNQSVGYLFGSFGGDWFLLITAALVLIGLIGGLLAKNPKRGALASGWASLILAFVGIVLTAQELPNISTDLTTGQLSQLISAVEITQLVGGCFAALLTGLMGALGGRALQYREKVPIEAVKPLKAVPVQPTIIEQEVEEKAAKEVEQGVDDSLRLRESQLPKDGLQGPYPAVEEDRAMSSKSRPALEETSPSAQATSSEPKAKGPLNRPPPCPHCGTPLFWIPEAKRYYCKVCAMYP